MHVLNIPGDYQFMDDELVELVKSVADPDRLRASMRDAKRSSQIPSVQ